MKRLAAGLELAKSLRSRIAKEEAIAQAFASIGSDDDPVALATAARLATGRTLPLGDGRTLGAGWSLWMDVVCARSGFPPGVVGACAGAAGDLGEAIGLLAAREAGAASRAGLPLAEVAALLEALASTGNRVSKHRLLDAALAKATPLETKYLAKALLGSLRVGAQEGVALGAVARAFGAPLEAVRRAVAIVADIGEVAVLAQNGKLALAEPRIGRPVAFMLASPLETIATPIDLSRYVVEDKIDGVRAQVHKLGPDVAIFARGLDRMTAAFPEIADAFQFANGDVALDGEIVAVLPDGKPRPFQALQARLRRVRPSADTIASTKVAFVAYDLLSDGAGHVLDLPWSERRARLDEYASTRAPKEAFVLHPYAPAEATPDEALRAPDVATRTQAAFDAARARGFEGLVLKRVDAPYEAGRRGQAWLKVKRAFATLDVVITAAEEGHGKRAGVLSDYTFGVWKDDRVVDVGKAYSGLTDDEIDAMSARLEALAGPGRSRLRRVPPEIVLEVAFDGVQPSTRHASGYALRFPRIVRIRDDKTPEGADRLETVHALFASQVESGHREGAAGGATASGTDAPAMGAHRPAKRGNRRGRAAKVPSTQLGLFDSAPETARAKPKE